MLTMWWLKGKVQNQQSSKTKGPDFENIYIQVEDEPSKMENYEIIFYKAEDSYNADHNIHIKQLDNDGKKVEIYANCL